MKAPYLPAFGNLDNLYLVSRITLFIFPESVERIHCSIFMVTLGIKPFGHDTGATIVLGGKIIAAEVIIPILD